MVQGRRVSVRAEKLGIHCCAAKFNLIACSYFGAIKRIYSKDAKKARGGTAFSRFLFFKWSFLKDVIFSRRLVPEALFGYTGFTTFLSVSRSTRPTSMSRMFSSP